MAVRRIRHFAVVVTAVAMVGGEAPAISLASSKVHHHAHHAAHSPITDSTNSDDEGCTAADGGHAICFE